jgi:exopolysaccharide biosynthesis polyprenyl glycosylphosphotransferase
MISRAQQADASPIRNPENAPLTGEGHPRKKEFTGGRDRRRQKRQQVRQTSLSSRPSLFSFRWAWVALDLIACLLTITLAQIAFERASGSVDLLLSCLLRGMPFVLFVLMASQISGLYRAGASAPLTITLVRIVRAVVPAALGLHWLQKLWGTSALPLGLVAWQVALTCAVLFCARLLWRRHREYLCKRSIARKNFLIVGADSIGHDVRAYLSSLRHMGYMFQGFVSMCESGHDALEVNEGDIVGGIHDVIRMAQAKFVDEIIFSRRPSTPGVLSHILRQAQPLGVSIRLIPSLTETLIDRTDVEYIGDLPTIAVFTARQRPMALMLKRAIDLSIAATALIVFFPVLLLIAAVIKMQSSGPVLYVSNRVGHKGRVFTCFKFRTMVNNAEEMRELLEHKNERTGGAFFKISDDPRVTPVGRILRKYSLDELPQLWNVVRGDMSLVGPRPPLDSETAQYNLRQLRRLDAVPGITGLWQVKARQDPSFEQTVALDSSYINNWSLLLDLSILLETVKVVFRGTGS